MKYEEKFAAINAIGEASLKMRKPGDWYVEQSRVDIKEEGASVIGSAYGNGESPEAAIEDHWRVLTELKPRWYVVLDSLRGSRRHVRWNGYMWADVPPDHIAEERV